MESGHKKPSKIIGDKLVQNDRQNTHHKSSHCLELSAKASTSFFQTDYESKDT